MRRRLSLQRILSLNSPEFRLRCHLNSGEFSYEWTEGAQSYYFPRWFPNCAICQRDEKR